MEEFSLNSYSAAVESFEHLESLFHVNPSDYPTLICEIQNCLAKIENIIELENVQSSTFAPLIQMKIELNFLLEIMAKRFQQNQTPQIDTTTAKRSFDFLNNSPENTRKKRKLLNIDGGTSSDNVSTVIKSTMETPKVTGLHEIVGLRDIKKTLKSLVILPKTQPQLFENRRICNSVLLFGPPGTGKTRLAHALAAEANAVLHCISASDVLSHYVGQTEKAIKTLFRYIKESDDFVILFIDEIDGICRKRSEAEQEHTRRIKTELMCQMSSTEDYKNLFLVCATNCPWDLDTAILRRFQKRIYVPLPCRLERLEFFQFFLQRENFDYDSTEWSPLLDKTEGCSGSDLSDLVQNALNIPLSELEETHVWKQTNDGFYEPAWNGEDHSNVICSELGQLPSKSVKARSVKMTDLLTAAENVVLTVSSSDVRRYTNFNGN